MPRRLLSLVLGTALACAAPVALLAQDNPQADLAGAYLAARQATFSKDFAAAAFWYDRALQVDPANPALLTGAVTAYLVMGDMAKADAAGQALQAAGGRDQVANLAVLLAHLQKEDYAKVLKDQKSGHSVGGLIDQLVTTWSQVGNGKMSDALSGFDTIIKTPGTSAFGLYHKALALASTGDFEGADKLLAAPEAAPAMTLRRAILARVQILSQLERDADAVALIDKSYGKFPDTGMADLRARLTKGEVLPYDVARNAKDGLAEVFFTVATALGSDADQTAVLIYVRAAALLRPDHVEAQLLSAGLFEGLEQWDQAIAAFATVPATDAAYISAQIGQADAMARANRLDDAAALLQKLSQDRPGDISVLTGLADVQRRQDRCDLAVPNYDAALALLPDPQPSNWPIFYKRAGCQLNLGKWSEAEADYRRALKLAPNEPRVLNELGYGYVDRGENLDEALTLIKRAVAAAPDSGYIVDSLAWAYFRMGRYEDAVAPQEKASKLMPNDPVVTDHLGDIYWMVGRQREAQFQWRRALSFKPDDKDKARIDQKLKLGLDAVLAAEKASNGN